MWDDRERFRRADRFNVQDVAAGTTGWGKAALSNGHGKHFFKGDILIVSARKAIDKYRGDSNSDSYRETRRIIPNVLPTLLISLLLISSCLTLAIPVKAQSFSNDVMASKNISDLWSGNDPMSQGQSASQSNVLDYQKAMRNFIENKGQFDNSVKFVAVTEFGKALFYDSKVLYLLERYEDGNLSGADVITLTFPGSAIVSPEGQDLQPHYTNYFIGNPNTWVSGAKNYRSITYHDLWPGIDLFYNFSEKGLKYEFTVDPYVLEERIRVQIEGAAVYCEPSCLTFDTGYGCLVDSDLIVSQVAGFKDLSAQFLAIGNIITFIVEGRDISKALLIDPLIYSTYIGGSGYDTSIGIAVDAIGNTYVTGYTNSSDFPSFSPFQAAQGGYYDAFVLKFNAAGDSLVYSTYIGGDDTDVGNDIAVDASGNAYVTGYTYSTDFPTFSPFQASNSGSRDVFVLKLNSVGNALIYSTYIGGSNGDIGYGIAVDASGNAYVSGYTNSTDFPTFSPFQASNSGSRDVFVLKLNSVGNALIYSTYIGGSGEDQSYDTAIDADGNAYVTGYTNSTDFPISSPFQAVKGGYYDAFALKLNAAGNILVYSTYIGGGDTDAGYNIAVDANGNAYVTGQTYSANFPTYNPYHISNSGSSDVFVLKLNSVGNALIYSTYIGGSNGDIGYGIAVDASGNAYVAGYTNSTDFPTSSPFQVAYGGGSFDAFILKFNAAGDSLVYSTYIGGSGYDTGIGIAVDASGKAYITGQTYSANFPTYNPYHVSNSGSSDIFVLKLGWWIVPSAPLTLAATPGNAQVVLTWYAPASDGGSPIDYYIVYQNDTDVGHPTGTSFTILDLTNGVQYSFKVAAHNAAGTGSQTDVALASPKASTSGGFGGGDLFILLGIVAAIVVAVLVALYALRARKRVQSMANQPKTPSPAQVDESTLTSAAEEPKFCPWCGEAESGSEFCGHCGRKVT